MIHKIIDIPHTYFSYDIFINFINFSYLYNVDAKLVIYLHIYSVRIYLEHYGIVLLKVYLRR